MFSLLDDIRCIVVFVFFIFMIQSSTSNSLENVKLALLIDRLDEMQIEMNAIRTREAVLVVENAQLTERLDGMQSKMDAIRSKMEVENAQLVERLNRMQTHVDTENDKWARKFGDLEAENEKLKRQISHPKFSYSPARKQDDGQPSRVLSSPPTSCQELKNQNGLWPMDGIHLLKKNNKIQAAFCTFAADGSPVSEEAIGNVDVKTAGIHFFVQRTSSFSKQQAAVIPWDSARVNEGGAMNLTTGIFTAPVSGIYHFEFSGVKDGDGSGAMQVAIQVNGVSNGVAHVGGTRVFISSSLTATLKLKASDKVNLFLNYGVLYDAESARNNQFAHFTGSLVEEFLN